MVVAGTHSADCLRIIHWISPDLSGLLAWSNPPVWRRISLPRKCTLDAAALSKSLIVLLVRSVDSLHDFRSRFGACLNHPSDYHRLEVANQLSKQAIRHQRLSLQDIVCSDGL
jgi:hypothetical protein